MYMRYYLDDKGNRVYTMKYKTENNEFTLSAHPARFSPDDKFSHERILSKQRNNVLLTQIPTKPY